MNQKSAIVAGLCLTGVSSLFAQTNTGEIRGSVFTNDHKPAAAVTIHLVNTKKFTTTNDRGSFTLKPVAAGTYQLEVSSMGYDPIRWTCMQLVWLGRPECRQEPHLTALRSSHFQNEQ